MAERLERLEARLAELAGEVRALTLEVKRQNGEIRAIASSRPALALLLVLTFAFLLVLCLSWDIHWAIAAAIGLVVSLLVYNLFRGDIRRRARAGDEIAGS